MNSSKSADENIFVDRIASFKSRKVLQLREGEEVCSEFQLSTKLLQLLQLFFRPLEYWK